VTKLFVKDPLDAKLPQTALEISRWVITTIARSVLLRAVMFAAVLWGVWNWAKPWELGWLRMDEAQEIAEGFLAKQDVNLQSYTLIKAVERRREGLWSARGGEQHFGVNPSVGYLLRYFRPGVSDGWTVAVAPTGRIYRVQREQPDDEPGVRLDRVHAFDRVLDRLANDLGVPAYSLRLMADTLVFQPQRSDWTFTFNWPEALGPDGTFRVVLGGEVITDLSFQPPPAPAAILPHRTARSSRIEGFILILAGVFLIMHYHRTPLALRTAGIWGGTVFGLTLLSRALTFPQSVILMPADSPLTGYMARIGLSAVIEALQMALMAGLVVATGEALSRDVFRQSTTLSRIPPGLTNWRSAWARAARWAFPLAAIVLIVEATAMHYWGPVGLCGKVPSLLSDMLSSPTPVLNLPVQIGLDVVWEECLYRLWLLSLLIFWLRLPVLAIPLSAGAAAYFAGFDFSQMTSVGGLFYLGWGMVAGWLMYRVGIVAAMLFHLLVLGGYVALALIWTGFGMHAAAIFLAAMLMLITVVAWDRRHPHPAQLEILESNP
jgi:hypothetical protein